jgi:hypothetical protein
LDKERQGSDCAAPKQTEKDQQVMEDQPVRKKKPCILDLLPPPIPNHTFIRLLPVSTTRVETPEFSPPEELTFSCDSNENLNSVFNLETNIDSPTLGTPTKTNNVTSTKTPKTQPSEEASEKEINSIIESTQTNLSPLRIEELDSSESSDIDTPSVHENK